MRMSPKRRTVLLRFVRVLASTILSAVGAIVVSPDMLDLVGPEVAGVLALVGPALVVSLDKHVRYGNDAGENLTGADL